MEKNVKTISVRELAAVKNIAKNIAALVAKRQSVIKKLQKAQAEYDAVFADTQEEISLNETPVTTKYGVSTDYIVKKVVLDTDKVDANGKTIKVTKYEPTEHLIYNEDTKNYTLVLPTVECNVITNEWPEDKEVETLGETFE